MARKDQEDLLSPISDYPQSLNWTINYARLHAIYRLFTAMHCSLLDRLSFLYNKGFWQNVGETIHMFLDCWNSLHCYSTEYLERQQKRQREKGTPCILKVKKIIEFTFSICTATILTYTYSLSS